MEQRLIDVNKLKRKQYLFQTVKGAFPKSEWFIKSSDLFGADPVLTIPKNPTNGDMLKAMFPDGTYDKQQNVFEHTDFSIVVLSDDWWNAPYKEGEKDAKTSL